MKHLGVSISIGGSPIAGWFNSGKLYAYGNPHIMIMIYNFPYKPFFNGNPHDMVDQEIPMKNPWG